jgi:hypothetical protein
MNNSSRVRSERPETQQDKQASVQLVRRIRKLRWIGLTEEAERLQKELEQTVACDCVLAMPRETD